MPASTILFIGSDETSGTLISGVLTGAGYTVTSISDANEAFARVADHQVVILDVMAGPKDAVEVCREIRSTPSLAAIPVLCVGQSDDVEERIRFLRPVQTT